MDLPCRNSSLMFFHGLLTKRGPLEARHETEDFNGKSEDQNFSKKLLISLCEMFSTHNFRVFYNL